MRKPKLSALAVVTLVFFAFTLGLFLGRTQNRDGITVTVPEHMTMMPASTEASAPDLAEETITVSFPISVNRAGTEEFMALPGIGEVLAQRIVEYRKENGDFSSTEDLLNVDGLGKKRLEEIRDLITIGG